MSSQNYFNDAPIRDPKDDQFGIDSFSQALSRSIKEIKAPVGATIAINGAWGSGKSSAVNLVLHHLETDSEASDIEVVDFRCWWFNGEEALTLAFLQELNAVIGKSVGAKAKELIPRLGKKLLQAGPVVGPAVNIATGGIFGALTSGSMDFAKRFFSSEESIEQVYEQLSDLLAQQPKRFLVVVDDVDRLAPDEALLVFRLIKSVGRLPNVIYLLAFDRVLAEKTVADKYPSEGPHFLEKIIQASFELPLPSQDVLNNAILSEIDARCGLALAGDSLVRFMNVFYDAVAPYIKQPRDLTRLSNSMAVSWPPVANEVNVADFVALEAIRLFEAKLYNAIRTSQKRICGIDQDLREVGNEKEETLKELLDHVSEQGRGQAKSALERLFPRLENVGYASDFLAEWDADRRVCVERHFPAFFKMALGDETLSMSEIETFIENCGDEAFVKKELVSAARVVRANGKSKIPLLLDELNVHARKVDTAKLQSLISAIFEVADEIYRPEDDERGALNFGNTHLRIHWLIRRLTFEQCSLEQRSKIFLTASQRAQVTWLSDFTSSAIADYFPRDGETKERPERCLVSEEDLEELKRNATAAIDAAAESSSLIESDRLAYVLYRWQEFVGDGGSTMRTWVAAQLKDDISVALLAKALTSQSWSHTFGDHVSVSQARVGVEALEDIADVDVLIARFEQLESSDELAEPYREYVRVFLAAYRDTDGSRRATGGTS